LRAHAGLEALCEAAASADRLVLLGDVVELRQGPVRDALAAASRVLVAVSRALPPGSGVVLVPGNHDHHLLDGWLARRAANAPPPPLALDDTVRWAAADPLAALADALAPRELQVRYPGVWLREDVYATHGHYLDRHTTVPVLERLGAGAMARLLGAPLAETRAPDDYEAALGPIYAWIHAVAQLEGCLAPRRGGTGAEVRVWQALGHSEPPPRGRGRAARRRALSISLRAAIAALNLAGLGPLSADLSGSALRRGGLRGFDQVLTALGVDARWAIFGHTHRAGPLPADDPAQWTACTGARLINTGCWVHEPAFTGVNPAQSPYRPGFAARIDDDGRPELINLLDG
jgi:hypothetical protein